MTKKYDAKECMWCHRMFEGEFIFCDECMEDETSFQDRWNIASQIEGELISKDVVKERTMRSIIRFDVTKDIDTALDSIAKITRGRIISYKIHDNEVFVTVGHHEGNWCPECSQPIHQYGHGLCLSCWRKKQHEI